MREVAFISIACALVASCGGKMREPPAAAIAEAGPTEKSDSGASISRPGASDGEAMHGAEGGAVDGRGRVSPDASADRDAGADAGSDALEERNDGADGPALNGIRVLAGAPGGPGRADDARGSARFARPRGVAPDGAGNLYVADTDNCAIRRVVIATGQVTTVAGSPECSPLTWASVDGIGTAARFRAPWGLAFDGANLYITDRNTLRKMDVATGRVATIAGSPDRSGNGDGVGDAATFGLLAGATLDGAGNLYVADSGQQTIRKIALATATVSTIAGAPGRAGYENGTGAGAKFASPVSVAADGEGNLYVADSGNLTVRKVVLATSEVTTLPSASVVSGMLSIDRLGGLAADGAGSLYYASVDHRIRKMSLATYGVTTVAGMDGGSSRDGVGEDAGFSDPWGLTTDGSGALYVADTSNHLIRKVDTATATVTTLAGLPPSPGPADGNGGGARFKWPSGVATDPAGNVYVADSGNYTIRKIAGATGEVTTLAGKPGAFDATDGVGPDARPGVPWDLVEDGAGNLYVTDCSNGRILRVSTVTGEVTTLAGGFPDAVGDADGIGRAARFWDPRGIALDGAGNLYVADSENHTIRKIVIATTTVTTLAGTAREEGATDETGAAARFHDPTGLAYDGSGILYVSDLTNHTIRRIVTATGSVTTLAGSPGVRGYVDGAKEEARFDEPWGMTMDRAGNLFVADAGNHVIRKVVVATGAVTTWIGTAARAGVKLGILPGALNRPMGVSVLPDKQIVIAESLENVILLAR